MAYSLTYDDIERYVADSLGYNHTSLSTRQAAKINDYINSGYRRFLDPPMIGPNGLPHVWSFLRVVAEFSTVADTQAYDAPVDFALLESDFTYKEPSALYRQPITQISDNRFRSLSQIESSCPHPIYSNIQWEANGDVVEPKFYFYPIPKDVYVLQYSYSVAKTKLSTGMIPLGGDVHSQTVLSAALAEAEKLAEENEGIHEKAFQERIRVSIAHDLRHSPRHFGYNGDGPPDIIARRAISVTHINQV